MDIRSIQSLQTLVNQMSRKMAGSDKFFTGRLAVRLQKAAQEHPSDQTIVQMASFLNNRSNSSKGYIITRQELKDVYSKLWTTNTKAAAFLQEELGENPAELPSPKKMTHTASETSDINIHEKFADQKLVSALESAFDKNKPYRPNFDPRVAKLAEKYVQASLPNSPQVETVDYRDFAILCHASYLTPKGKVSVFVPVEVVDSQPLMPTIFVSQAGFSDLTTEAVKDYIIKSAGKSLRVNSDQIFEVIKVAKFGRKEELDSVDMAVMSLKAKTASIYDNFDPNGIINQKVDDDIKPFAIPESEDTKKFAKELGSLVGAADFVFGKDVVNQAICHIRAKLANAGITHSKVSVAKYAEDSITFAVAANGSGFKVPVKLVKKPSGKYAAVEPRIMIASGGIEEFSTSGITEALASNDIAAYATALGDDTTSTRDLLTEMEDVCSEGKYDRAGDIVNIIAARGDETAFKYAFELYNNVLFKQASKEPEKKMKLIRVGGKVVEATTGLPADQVYMDANGEVHRKYRRNMENTDAVSAAGLMNSKIILGM